MSDPVAGRHLFKSPDAVYREAYEGRQFDAVYFMMLIFACLVALMGLLLNSPAVIIGAMLISPLMGPILACGLALTTAEWPLGKKAIRNLGLSIVEVVLIAVIATQISPLREATPEILARTNPNLMDLFIAFFSGLAGTVALASRRTAFTILPGVAIATAVMPPLATVGYGLGTGQWPVAAGAFMLFFTNFGAIVLSASLVFLLIGVRPQSERAGIRHSLLIRSRIAIAALLLVLISVPLLRTLMHAATQARVRRHVQAVLAEALEAKGARKLDAVRVEVRDAGVAVNASVQTAEFIEHAEVEALRAAVEQRIGQPATLRMEQLQLARRVESPEKVIRDFLAAGMVRQQPPPKPPSAAAEIEGLQRRIEASLNALLNSGSTRTRIPSLGRTEDGTLLVRSLVTAHQLPSPDAWQVAAAALAREVEAPVRLHAQGIEIGGALSVRYPGAAVRLPAPEARRLREFARALPQGMAVAIVPSAGMPPELAARRIEELRTRLRREVADFPLDAPADANTIQLAPITTLETSAGATAQPR